MSPNRLAGEKSPYLLQHKDNPVPWYAWGEAAFAAAKAQNKIIFLSIGYSTCYWCHMMEKDSFEIAEVGQALGQDFISIKVDREEHPDVDQIYMDAVMGLTGRGGWPLTVFLTPDLKPFFGGTFFWRTQFLQILAQIAKVWHEEPQRIAESAQKITAHLQNSPSERNQKALTDAHLKNALSAFGKNFDALAGGFGGAPKFPQATQISLLLRLQHRSQDAFALEMAEKTLTAMAHGGLFDHVGGGFHRYSTDERWFLPHFEKMLYDNALLVLAYADAWQITKKPMYADVVRETLDFVLREMTDPQGGFYTALDAGEVDEEGDDYVWTHAELRAVLPDAAFADFIQTFGVTPDGNWEGQKNVLHLPPGQSWDQRVKLVSHLKTLLTVREKRKKPRLDSKILTSWNGLMIAAMAKGSQILDDDKYLKAAQKSAGFIFESLHETKPPHGLLRSYCDGVAHLPGTLDDYAFLIFGLLHLYAVDFDVAWIHKAQALQKQQDALFWDAQNGGYFFTRASQTDLIVRKKDLFDGALPSGNAVTALNLQKLYGLTHAAEYKQRLAALFPVFADPAERAPLAATQALVALDYALSAPREVAVVLPQDHDLAKAVSEYLRTTFLPYQVLSLRAENSPAPLPLAQGKNALQGQTTFFVCEEGACQKPTADFSEFKKQIERCAPLKL